MLGGGIIAIPLGVFDSPWSEFAPVWDTESVLTP